MSVELVGPFEEHRVVVDGLQVPHLTATPMPGGKVNLLLDSRLGLDVEVVDLEAVTRFVADAVAIGMGYASFGGPKMPPFPKLTGITSVEMGEAPPSDDWRQELQEGGEDAGRD